MQREKTVSAGGFTRQRQTAFDALLQITREVLGDFTKPAMPKIK